MRVVLLVLDGLGVGAMPDAASHGFPGAAHTLRHVAESADGLSLPTLTRLGLGNVAPVPGLDRVPTPAASHGRCALAYAGADSHLGHQEIMGTIPPSPERQLLSEVAGDVAQRLRAAGHHVGMPQAGAPLLVVDHAVVIGDNLEAAPGQAINVTVPTAVMPFDAALVVARQLRAAVRVSRVIVCGGPSVTMRDILAAVEMPPTGQIGVNTPKLGIYDGDYVVQHLGYGCTPVRQLHRHFRSAGVPVALFGKMADLIQGDVDLRRPTVHTRDLLAELIDWVVRTPHGLAAATVQETDLAGHEQDAGRFADVLRTVDSLLHPVLGELATSDVLVITGDHGNDPRVGGGRHTREYVPVLWYRPGQAGRSLRARRSLSDIAASLAAHAGIRWNGDGTAFVEKGGS